MTIEPNPWTASVAWFVAAPVIGRCVLAWLPPGAPGRHGAADRVATYGASLAIALALAVALEAGVRTWPGLDAHVATLVIVLAALALGVARYVSRPAAMVPRHEPPLERESFVSRALGLATVVAALAAGAGPTLSRWFSGRGVAPWPASWLENDVSTTAAALALGALVAHGARTARCSPVVRAAAALASVAGLALARTAAHDRAEVIAAALAGSAVAVSVAWFRRADARGLALAIVLLAGAGVASDGGFALAIAGLLGLIVGSARPARVRVAVAAVAALVVVFVLGREWPPLASWSLNAGARASRHVVSWTPFVTAWGGVLILVVLVGRWRRSRVRRGHAWNPSGARVGLEEDVWARALVAYLLLRLAEARFSPAPAQDDPLLPALVWLAIAAALAARSFSAPLHAASAGRARA